METKHTHDVHVYQLAVGSVQRKQLVVSYIDYQNYLLPDINFLITKFYFCKQTCIEMKPLSFKTDLSFMVNCFCCFMVSLLLLMCFTLFKFVNGFVFSQWIVTFEQRYTSVDFIFFLLITKKK